MQMADLSIVSAGEDTVRNVTYGESRGKNLLYRTHRAREAKARSKEREREILSGLKMVQSFLSKSFVISTPRSVA